MIDRKKIINQIEVDIQRTERTGEMLVYVGRKTAKDALALLKEQGKKKLFVDSDGKITLLPDVVRCKDCKWYHQAFVNEGRCVNHDNDFHNPDWFCADGVRR